MDITPLAERLVHVQKCSFVAPSVQKETRRAPLFTGHLGPEHHMETLPPDVGRNEWSCEDMDHSLQGHAGLGRKEDQKRDAAMREAAARAEEKLRAAGKLELEIEAREEINRRVLELVSEAA